MAQQQKLKQKQLVLAVEGTAATRPFWQTILSDYLDKIIRSFSGGEGTGQKLSGVNPEFALVVFNSHGPYSACLVQRSGWTKDANIFFQWLHSIPFMGGGFSEAAVADGLSEALMMLLTFPGGNQSQQNVDCQRHCILVATSNPNPLPTRVPWPPTQNLDKSDSKEVPSEMYLADAETLAKFFPQNHISLSVFSPKQLPKLRAIYSAGKHNPRAADPTVDYIKNSQFLVLLSEDFVEACAALSHPRTTVMQPNQGVVKVDGPSPVTSTTVHPPTSAAAVSGPLINRRPMSTGNLQPATVKVEPTTLPSTASAAAFSRIPSISTATSQANVNVPNSTPSPTSQELSTTIEPAQEFKPVMNSMSQPLCPAGPAAAKVSILSSLSQARNVMNSASMGGANPIGLLPIGGAPMAMHMSTMISNGMASSTLSGMSSIPGSGALMTNAQVGQNTALSSFTSTTTNQPANSNLEMSTSLTSIQSSAGMGQTLPVMSQARLTSVSQSGIAMNQNVMNGLPTSGISSGSGAMIPTPGMSQQGPTGLHSLGANTGSTMNLPSQQHPPGGQQQPRYVKIWEGALSGLRQEQPVFICRIKGYRNATASDKLADDWPNAMQFDRLISQDHMNDKQYVGKPDSLVFQALNQHGFLVKMQEKKLCAVILLPSQILLLSVSNRASRLIGKLFPADTLVYKPQLSIRRQQLQQRQLQSKLCSFSSNSYDRRW